MEVHCLAVCRRRSLTQKSRLMDKLVLVVDQEGDNARRSQLFNFFFVLIVGRLGFKHCVYSTSNAAWKDWDRLSIKKTLSITIVHSIVVVIY
jgi:hypothetical protein